MEKTYFIYIKGSANYKISKSAYAYTIIDSMNHKKVSGGDVSDSSKESHIIMEHKALRTALIWIIYHSRHYFLHDTFIIRTSSSFIYRPFREGHYINLDLHYLSNKNKFFHINDYDMESRLLMLRFDDIHVEYCSNTDSYMKYTRNVAKDILHSRMLNGVNLQLLVPKKFAHKINKVSENGKNLWRMIGLIDIYNSYNRLIKFAKSNKKYRHRLIQVMFGDIYKGYKNICNSNKKIKTYIPLLRKYEIKSVVRNHNYKLINKSISFNKDPSNDSDVFYYFNIINNQLVVVKRASLVDLSNTTSKIINIISSCLVNNRNDFIRYKHLMIGNCDIKIKRVPISFHDVGVELKKLPEVTGIELLSHGDGIPEWHIRFDAGAGYDEVFLSVNENHTYYCGFLGTIHNTAIPESIRNLVEGYITTDEQEEHY